MRLWSALVLLALAGRSGPAKAFEGGGADPLPAWRLGGYFGVARHSPLSDRWGGTPDRKHVFLGFHAAATVLRAGPLSIAYAPEVVPLHWVSNNPKYATSTRMQNGRLVSVEVERGRGPVVGSAIAPFGLEADLRLGQRWCAYGATSAGVAWFTREVPVLHSNATNYTFEFGGGLMCAYRRGRWLQVGYKFHHLSNDRTAPRNPGLNAQLFYLGWQGRLRRSSDQH